MNVAVQTHPALPATITTWVFGVLSWSYDAACLRSWKPEEFIDTFADLSDAGPK